jgi:hypothetical protein
VRDHARLAGLAAHWSAPLHGVARIGTTRLGDLLRIHSATPCATVAPLLTPLSQPARLALGFLSHQADPFQVDWTDPTPGNALAQQVWLREEPSRFAKSNALLLSPDRDGARLRRAVGSRSQPTPACRVVRHMRAILVSLLALAAPGDAADRLEPGRVLPAAPLSAGSALVWTTPGERVSVGDARGRVRYVLRLGDYGYCSVADARARGEALAGCTDADDVAHTFLIAVRTGRVRKLAVRGFPQALGRHWIQTLYQPPGCDRCATVIYTNRHTLHEQRLGHTASRHAPCTRPAHRRAPRLVVPATLVLARTSARGLRHAGARLRDVSRDAAALAPAPRALALLAELAEEQRGSGTRVR